MEALKLTHSGLPRDPPSRGSPNSCYRGGVRQSTVVIERKVNMLLDILQFRTLKEPPFWFQKSHLVTPIYIVLSPTSKFKAIKDYGVLQRRMSS